MKLLPQKDEFFDLLDQLSSHMVTIAQQLQQMPRQYPDNTEIVARIREEEKAADALTMSELKKLDSAFITPIDREDIMRLMSGLYGVVESMADAAYYFDSYRFAKIDAALQGQLDSLQSLVSGTGDLIQPLRDGHSLSDLEDKFRTVRKLKQETDRTRRDGLSQVLAQNENSSDMLKRMDMERLLRTVVDRCDAVRATLQEVVLKNS